jgi:uncharacterized protein (TIGR02996 family)
MPDESAFLEAIRAAPDTDGPRLVYADWLDEQGDVRGEFIRVQCELAGFVESDERYAELRRRERELLDAHEADWLGVWRGRPGACEFRRGAVVVRAACYGFPDWPELTAPAPPGVLPWQAVLSVNVYPPAPVRCVEALEAAAPFPGLVGLELPADQWLNLWLHRAPDPAFRLIHALRPFGIELTTLPDALDRVLPHLAGLDLSGTSAPVPELVEQLPRLLPAGRLRRLNLSGRRLGPAVARALGELPQLLRLTELDLSGNRLRDSGVQALLEGEHLAGLCRLRLNGNEIGGLGVRALLESDIAGELTGLALGGNYISETTARVLAGTDRLPRLTALEVGEDLDDASLVAFARASILRRLEFLRLEGHQIADGGLEALARSPGLRRLRGLGLRAAAVTDAGVRALAAAPWIAGLESLRLHCERLTGDALAALRDAGLPRLEELDLSGCGYAVNRSAEVLADAPGFPRLRRLRLGYVGDAAVSERLRARFGPVFVE